MKLDISKVSWRMDGWTMRGFKQRYHLLIISVEADVICLQSSYLGSRELAQALGQAQIGQHGEIIPQILIKLVLDHRPTSCPALELRPHPSQLSGRADKVTCTALTENSVPFLPLTAVEQARSSPLLPTPSS